MGLQRIWRRIDDVMVFVTRKFCVADLSDLSSVKRQKIRAAQLNAIYKMMPTSILLNLFNMMLVWLVIEHHVPQYLMFLWVGATLLAVTITFFVWRRDRMIYRLSAPRKAAAAISFQGAARALAWGFGIIAFFPIIDAEHQLVVGLTMVGMMAGGAFSMSTLPVASVLYIAILSVSGSIALWSAGGFELNVLGALMVGFAAYLIRHVRHHGRLFVEYWRAGVINDEQRETIAILLNEFEENSSDWLWQTNVVGGFVNVSERFAQAAGRSVAQMNKLTFAELFDPGIDARNVQALSSVAERLAMQDAIVSIEVDGIRQFWSLTSRPVTDEQGDFAGIRGVAADVSDQLRSAQKLENLAHYDQLTGLANRARFSEIAAQAFDSCPLEEIGLLIIDFNGFKSINDTLGHPVGDGLLQQIGARMKEWAGSELEVARLGGDEFAVLLTRKAPERAEALAASLLQVIEEPFDVGPHILSVNACVGIGLAGPDAKSTNILMKNADLALYAAKSRGGGQYNFFEKSMATSMLRRQRLERGLRNAIERDELSLRFQPIVDVWTGKVKSFETLLRWQSPEFGAVGPDEFISIAEESGMIVEIGEWVLENAIKEAANWPKDILVAVNISPAQLRDNRLLAFLVNCLDKSGLPPSRLEIEITEGVFLESSEHIEHTLHALLDLGIKIALDDFGTGYSSLSYLRSFPFSKVKIDKSFVDNLAESDVDNSIVKAIIEMATSLGFEVVAEGVETPEQLAVLTRLGCDYVQGYLFAPPQRANELGEMPQAKAG